MIKLLLVCVMLSAIQFTASCQKQETYEQVNPSDLPFAISGDLIFSVVNGDPSLTKILAKELSISGKKIELEVNELTKVGEDEYFIKTKNFDKVKVVFDFNSLVGEFSVHGKKVSKGSFFVKNNDNFKATFSSSNGETFWLTPSQVKQFRRLLNR